MAGDVAALRAAFAELTWEVHAAVVEDDLVAVRCTMAGRHTGDLVGYDVEGRVAQVFADPALDRRLRAAALAYVRRFDWDAIADGYLRLYRQAARPAAFAGTAR